MQKNAENSYFVIETKSNVDCDKLRGEECYKIDCAKKHFKELEVDYYPVDNFETFEEIFNYGLSLCKWHKKKHAQDFFTAYIYYLYNVNTREDVPTIEYAEQCAKKNFGYF